MDEVCRPFRQTKLATYLLTGPAVPVGLGHLMSCLLAYANSQYHTSLPAHGKWIFTSASIDLVVSSPTELYVVLWLAGMHM
jgi:hypothetical protein